jgi:hypothetical protein
MSSMMRSLWFVHVMLVLAMMAVGGMASTILSSGSLDQSRTTQLWLVGVAFGVLIAAGMTTSFILSKSGFHRTIARPAMRHSNLRG